MSNRKLGRNDRLTLARDIDRVFAEGTWSRKGCVNAGAVANSLGYSRLGVGVSSRMCNAVRRNRLKRLIREAFRLNRDALPRGLDIFVTATRIDSTSKQVAEDLISAGRKLVEKMDVK